jgi:hypothetical protein
MRSSLIPLVWIAAATAQAQQASTHLLQGTWTLVRAEVIAPDGTKGIDPAYGAQAQGLLIVDDHGRYSLQIFRPDRPKFSSGDKTKGTADEYKAAMIGTSTHIGRVTVDTVRHTLLFHIERASFPNQDETEQTRAYQLSNGVLSYTIPPRPDGSRAVSVWRRVE